MLKYKTSDEQARLNAATFLEICYACFFGILALPLMIIGIIFLATLTPPFGAYLAMLILGILFLVLAVLATLNSIWLRHYLVHDQKQKRIIQILQLVTLNFYGYFLLKPEKPKKEKPSETKVESTPSPAAA